MRRCPDSRGAGSANTSPRVPASCCTPGLQLKRRLVVFLASAALDRRESSGRHPSRSLPAVAVQLVNQLVEAREERVLERLRLSPASRRRVQRFRRPAWTGGAWGVSGWQAKATSRWRSLERPPSKITSGPSPAAAMAVAAIRTSRGRRLRSKANSQTLLHKPPFQVGSIVRSKPSSPIASPTCPRSTRPPGPLGPSRPVQGARSHNAQSPRVQEPLAGWSWARPVITDTRSLSPPAGAGSRPSRRQASAHFHAVSVTRCSRGGPVPSARTVLLPRSLQPPTGQ